jgi:Peptidase A4 family/PASTA domain
MLMFNLTLWRPAMIAVATVTALAAGGGAAYAAVIPSTAPASTAPGGVIYATGVHASAAQSIRSSSPAGALTLKTTDAYAADQTSPNWSGYVTPEKTGAAAYKATSTTFTVPASITCTSTDTASSFWAGLDGYADGTVEQDGVEADCTDGSLALYAWVETFPAPEEEIVSGATETPAPVQPGDVVVSTVTEDSPSEYTFAMDDETQGWSVDAGMAMPTGSKGEGQTSEVITEATTECNSDGSDCAIMPLTNFGKVAYTRASYNSGTNYASSNTTPIELFETDGIRDSVGALGTDGAFTVTYGTPTAVVPNEIGRADLATAEAGIRAAGLVAKAAGASAVGNKGEVTAESPAAGTRVAVGSTVTLTYTIPKVTVPSEIGRADLATAEAGIRAAGLVPKAAGASGVGNKGKVTAESPAAGSKVAKGSTVTLTYTVAK